MKRTARFAIALLTATTAIGVTAADKSAVTPALQKATSLQTPAQTIQLQKKATDNPKKKTSDQNLQSVPQSPVMQPSIGSPASKQKTGDNAPDSPDRKPQALPSAPGTHKQSPTARPLPALPAGTQKAMQSGNSPGLPQVGKPSFAPKADRVEIKLSGVGIYGGSTVGGDDGEMLTVGRPGIIVMVNHGGLWIHGVVPGERDTYSYYLIVQRQSEGPGACRATSPAGQLTGVVVDKPDVQGDGRVRVIGSGGNRQIRNVSVPQGDILNKFYIRLCVVGKNPDTGEFAAISSNITQLAIIPE